MSDIIKHECGIALVRLLQPLEYYQAKYSTSFYGLNKLHLLMEKQHNRGQDGAGVVNIKFDLSPGNQYINRVRSNAGSPIKDIFGKIFKKINAIQEKQPERLKDVNWLKNNADFTGELFLGHLRYGTFGKNMKQNLHPLIRFNNWMTKSLVLAGNFNLTNVDELFDILIDLGQYPVETSDTITILEKIGHFLDKQNEELYHKFKEEGFDKRDISNEISKNLDIGNLLENASKNWDGGYTIAGLIGHGDAFVMRDPVGIRPAYYYQDEELIVATSERPTIQTAFNVPLESVKELLPGHALIIKKDGNISINQFTEAKEKKSCSFERIYFSRGTDAEIYQERKKLGKNLVPSILQAVNYDLENTVFSYIPNTAVVAFRGMAQALDEFCNKIKIEKIGLFGWKGKKEEIDKVLSIRPRIEIITVKDVKLRTFITRDTQRDDLVTHVYDITYGVVREGKDNLVVIDDSIVRGTTLKHSIIRILDRLGPKRIIIASSAPQIRYPDCYGIDMTKISDFIAFNAAIELLKETNQTNVINEIYKKCKEQEKLPKEEIINHVKDIYRPFTAEQISEKIAQMLTVKDIQAEIQIIYQTIEDLHEACPNHLGDWYFTGDYPTPGGNKVVNMSFINYIEGKNQRAY
ncbi:amidophosphoribosyltransferase [candidate division KSB1 bacterium]